LKKPHDLRLVLKAEQLQRLLPPTLVLLPRLLCRAGSALCVAAAELAQFYFQSLHTVCLSEYSNSATVTRSRAADFDRGMGPGT